MFLNIYSNITFSRNYEALITRDSNSKLKSYSFPVPTSFFGCVLVFLPLEWAGHVPLMITYSSELEAKMFQERISFVLVPSIRITACTFANCILWTSHVCTAQRFSYFLVWHAVWKAHCMVLKTSPFEESDFHQIRFTILSTQLLYWTFSTCRVNNSWTVLFRRKNATSIIFD